MEHIKSASLDVECADEKMKLAMYAEAPPKRCLRTNAIAARKKRDGDDSKES
jgi:hypothetical protein